MTIPPSPTIDEAAVTAFARVMLDLDIPREAIAGVVLNLATLADHRRRLEPDAPSPAKR